MTTSTARARRAILGAIAVATVAAGTVGLPAPATADETDVSVHEFDLSGVANTALGDLPSIAPEPDEGTAVPEVPSATGRSPRLAPSSEPSGAAPEPDVLTTKLDATPFSLVGITWDAGSADGVVIRYRVRQSGSWTDWEAVAASDAQADSGSKESHVDRDGTDPIVALHADGIQIWAQADSGVVTGLKAVLIDPGVLPADAQIEPIASSASAVRPGGAVMTAPLVAASGPSVATAAYASAPTIITRAQWGADESQVACQPDLSTSMVSAAIHHTASTNDYTAADVPALIRGFMAYHTRPEAQGGRGWCDIGYNFLVDKFGRIFEGRAGSIDSPVVGVHTGGFNSRTVGVAAIGNYETAAPSDPLLESLSQVVAWKFATYRILANATVTMVSGGGDSKYPEGTVVSFQTIYGHRDAQLTSCPGQYLYDDLQVIRDRVAGLTNDAVAHSPFGSLDVLSSGLTTVRAAGWVVDPDTSESAGVVLSVDGAATTVTASNQRPDIAAQYGLGERHGFDVAVPLDGQRHRVCMSWLNLGTGNDVLVGCRWMSAANRLPIGSLDVVSTTPSTIHVAGWALDPDTSASIGVHAYIDGTWGGATTASNTRPDVAAAYGVGAQHGYDFTLPTTAGTHTICLYGIDANGGPNPAFACRTTTTTTTTR